MPLQGQLGHIGLADVLQTALAGSRGGELTVVRGPERAVLHLTSEGLFLIEPDVLEAQDVLLALAERGALPAAGVDALQGGKANPDTLLDDLVQGGQLPEAQVLEIVAGAVEDTVLTLLTWREGAFRFQEGAPTGARKGLVARVGVDLEGVLLRAATRMDEREVIERVVGVHGALFHAESAAPPPSDPEERLEEVQRALDGRATAGEIGLRLGLSRFAVLKAVAALIEAGAARAASTTELSAAFEERLSDKRLRLAREIAMQWATDHASDPGGVRALVRVAEARERPAEVAAALTLLGERLFARGEHGAALGAYQDAISRRPGEKSALEGLRRAADASGDATLWASTTLRLGQTLLEEDDPAGTRALAAEILARTEGDVAAMLLDARACVALKDREALVVTAQAIVDRLGSKPGRRVEREAADFCRDAVALLAPERSDLLRGLRRLTENPRVRRKRVALVGALLAVAATTGFVLWPASAGSLLEKARNAADGGNASNALELTARILSDFPDSEEATEAAQLQTRLAPAPNKPKPALSGALLQQTVAPRLPAFAQALAALPTSAGREALKALRADLAPPGRSGVLPVEATTPLTHALQRMALDARSRRDALGMAKVGRERSKDDLTALRNLMVQAEAARALEPLADLKASVEATAPFVTAAVGEPVRRMARELAAEVTLLERTIASHGPDILELRRRVVLLEIEASHATCREQGPRLLVGGRLADADALYADLEKRLAQVATDPLLAPVRETLERKRLDDFVRERRALLAEVTQGLEAARAAALAGDLEAAAGAFHALAQRHYTIRFEELVRIPLELSSVPAGAEVSLNGTVVGVTPLRLDYPWGGPTTLSVAAPGFEPHVTMLDTTKAKPVVRLTARLAPTTRWSAPLGGQVEARPLDVGGDVLLSDRSGRLTLLSGVDGRARWTRHLKSLEGARGRPALLPGVIVAAFLDGRVACLDARDGELLAEHQIARPMGDLAAHDGVAAVAVGTPALVGMRTTGVAWTTPLPAHVTAGVIAAHGSFWVGLANGELWRVDPGSGRATRADVGMLGGQVTGLAATPTGLLVASQGGRLASLDVSARTRWTAENLGELLGAPAEAAGRVAVADRKGNVLLLDARDGAPVSAVPLGRETMGGLLARGDTVAAVLSDGRLWVYDARTLLAVAEASLSAKGAGPMSLVGSGHLAVVTKDGDVRMLPFVAAPPASK